MSGSVTPPRQPELQRSVPAEDRQVPKLFEDVLAYAQTRAYTGWDYGDGMSSRILRTLPIENRWVNIAFQETIKRFPVNVRPLFLVEQRRNYKGTALFAMANQIAARLKLNERSSQHRSESGSGSGSGSESESEYDVDYHQEANELLTWLVDNRCDGYSGYCGSHQHRIQHLTAQGQPSDPDIVSTSFGVKALLRGGAINERFPDIARTAPEFVMDHLNYRPVESGRGAIVNYHLNHSEDHYTINAGALCARLFIDLYDYYQTSQFREQAEALLDHIADLQTGRGGWTYRDPPETSHLSMDNHHNGFIIESFQRYRQVTGDDRYSETLETARRFYRQELFEPDGAPNFDEKNAYPRDIHAATQGVLVFTYADELAFARQILQWVFDTLHAGNGQFYYRRERFYTRRVTLMRWCQAWMAYAMAEYLDWRRRS